MLTNLISYNFKLGQEISLLYIYNHWNIYMHIHTNACIDIERVFEGERSKSKVNKGFQMIARSSPF